MESSSPIFISPSFNTNPSNDIADIADRVVQQLRIENGFQNDDVFTFSDEDDDDNPTVISNNDDDVINTKQTVDRNENDDVFTFSNDDVINTEHEFEFPSVSTDDVISDDQISLRYPVFDQSLLSETDLSSGNGNGVDSPETECKTVTSPRQSLRKLFSEDRDAPSTSSSSDTDNLEGVTPGTYCVWKPKTVTETETERPRGKHKKSMSISSGSTSKKWKVRDLLKRSYSDDSYSTGKEAPVVVFLPPLSPKRKVNGEKVNKSEVVQKNGKVGGGVGGGVTAIKTERNIPAYRTKIGNIRVPPYLPYRQGQVAGFGNFTGSSKNLYRY